MYHERYRESTFKVDCLREYTRYAPFRTVEFDFPFYRPPTERQLRRYAAVLPPGFPVVSKVWEELTIARFPELPRQPDGSPPRHADRANQENARYLDPRVFREEVLPPYERGFAGHTGPFILEFPTEWNPTPEARRAFCAKLDAFLMEAEAPPGHSFAVEIRTPAYFAPEYFDVLRRRDAAHVFNWWTRTPPLLEQWEAAQPLASRRALIRILVRPGCSTPRRSSASPRPHQAPCEDIGGSGLADPHVTDAGADARARRQPRRGMRAADDHCARARAGIPAEDWPRPATTLFDLRPHPATARRTMLFSRRPTCRRSCRPRFSRRAAPVVSVEVSTGGPKLADRSGVSFRDRSALRLIGSARPPAGGRPPVVRLSRGGHALHRRAVRSRWSGSCERAPGSSRGTRSRPRQ